MQTDRAAVFVLPALELIERCDQHIKKYSEQQKVMITGEGDSPTTRDGTTADLTETISQRHQRSMKKSSNLGLSHSRSEGFNGEDDEAGEGERETLMGLSTGSTTFSIRRRRPIRSCTRTPTQIMASSLVYTSRHAVEHF